MSDLINRIKKFNANRIPQQLARKYAGMNENAFRFFRGSCHLFYEDLPKSISFNSSPTTWLCGDLHLENFGSFKADNGMEYFDINDFDEAALAPCLLDVARLLVSVVIAAEELLQTNEVAALELCGSLVGIYADTLKEGRANMIEKRTSKGLVKDFLKLVEKRKNIELLEKRTEKKQGKRKLIVDEVRVSKIDKEKKEQIASIIEKWAEKSSQHQRFPDFYKVLDAGYRIAGTGSLGIERYVLLVEGEGSPDSNLLLDLKRAQPSSLLPYLSVKQPVWKDEATRIIEVQKRMQAFSPALLTTLDFEDNSFWLKQLQPSQDKMDLTLCEGKIEKLYKVLKTFAQLTAYAHLRAGGRQGSAMADELIDFAATDNWQKPLLDYVKGYAEQVKQDYKLYAEAYKAGDFGNGVK